MRMRLLIALLAGCGGSDPPAGSDGSVDSPPNQCEPQPAIGQFTRRMGNPRIVAGATFTDGKLDIAFSDPDVVFDGTTFHVFYAAEHSTAFGTPGTPLIRHATSPDKMTWTVADAPVLTPSAAWDSVTLAAPSVVFDPDAPSDRRFMMFYSGSAAQAGGRDDTRIGMAISADGNAFTRISAADSPHGEAGLVFEASDAYASVAGGNLGFVDDPDVVRVDGTYHLFFSSFVCTGNDCNTPVASGVGHATSSDGIHWTTAQAPVKSLLRASADDKTGGRAPSVSYDAVHCKWELWLTNDQAADISGQPVSLDNMAGVFKAESTDGIQWSINYTGNRELAWNMGSPAAGEKLGLRVGADVAQASGGRLMMWVGYDDQNVPAGSTLPSGIGTRSGVMTIDLATRDLP